MPGTCCAVDCHSRYSKEKGMKLFRFPTNPSRRDAWIRAISRNNWIPNEYSWICQLHFISGKPSPFPNNPDYVPFKFSFSVVAPERQVDTVTRYERLQARRKRQSHPRSQQLGLSEAQHEQPDDITELNCNEGPSLEVMPSEQQLKEALFSGEEDLIKTNAMLEEVKEKLQHAEESKKANVKIAALEEKVEAAEESLEKTQAKFEEVANKLHKSDEEKMLLCQLHQATSVASKIKNDDKQTHFYTGLPSHNAFTFLLTHLFPIVSNEKSTGSGLTLANELLVCLIKISRGSTNQQIGYLFEIHETKVTKVFHKWIDAMFQGLQPLIVWPDKEMIITHLPACFKPHYSKAVCIIDCLEIFIERPTSLTARGQTYSNYKSHNTVKFLVAITPTGTVSFMSKCWGGRASDRHVTVNSGLLKHLKYGDLVLADRGFDISDDLAMVGASLAIPPFTIGKPQLSQQEVGFS